MKVSLLSVLVTLAVFCAWEASAQPPPAVPKGKALDILKQAGVDANMLAKLQAGPKPRTVVDLMSTLHGAGLDDATIKQIELAAQQELLAGR